VEYNLITIKVIKDNEVTNQGSFETQAEADIWLEKELKNNSFGEPGSFQIKVEYN
jgi:hypothetical protein